MPQNGLPLATIGQARQAASRPGHPRRALGHAAGGFTLIELLVTLAIVAALVVLVAPSLHVGRDLITGQRLARDISGQLSRARSAAIFQQRPIGVTFAADGLHSELEDKRYLLSEAWQLRQAEGTQFHANEPLVIRFFPDGTSSGGALQLTDGHRHFYLKVAWLTGRVQIATTANAG